MGTTNYLVIQVNGNGLLQTNVETTIANVDEDSANCSVIATDARYPYANIFVSYDAEDDAGTSSCHVKITHSGITKTWKLIDRMP